MSTAAANASGLSSIITWPASGIVTKMTPADSSPACPVVAGGPVEGEIAGFAQAHFLEEHPVNHGPAGFYLTGVTVLSDYRRAGLGRSFTMARLGWIRERANEAWYFAIAENRTSIQLHLAFGFEEVQRAQTIHDVTFDGGEGILFRSSLDGGASRGEVHARP